MTSKNDLSALKVKSKNTLEILQKEQNQTALKAWRKPLPKSEKQTEIVWLRFTKSEHEVIKKQAGLIPVATFLKDKLHTNTSILKGSPADEWSETR